MGTIMMMMMMMTMLLLAIAGQADPSSADAADESFPLWLNALMLAGVLVSVGVTWVTTARAADGRLGPNTTAGMRTRATLASPQAWTAGHVAALGVLRIAIPVTAVVTLVGVVLAFVEPVAGFVVLLGAELVLLAWMWPTIRAANAAARAADA